MFTIEQIKTAHGKVKSGADYPKYVQEIIQLGVKGYETWVTDGNTSYFGNDQFKIESGPKYTALSIAEKSDPLQFQKDLRAHQQGASDFPTFCLDCAKSGIEKWVVDLNRMTCTYYDRAANPIVVEPIPVA